MELPVLEMGITFPSGPSIFPVVVIWHLAVRMAANAWATSSNASARFPPLGAHREDRPKTATTRAALLRRHTSCPGPSETDSVIFPPLSHCRTVTSVRTRTPASRGSSRPRPRRFMLVITLRLSYWHEYPWVPSYCSEGDGANSQAASRFPLLGVRGLGRIGGHIPDFDFAVDLAFGDSVRIQVEHQVRRARQESA